MRVFGGAITGVLALILVALIITGCVRARAPAAGPRPRSTAELDITYPQIGQAVPAGSTLRLRLSLTGGRVVDQTSTNLRPDEGHIHLKLDGNLITMTSSLEYEVPVTPGLHLLEAEFVASDHFPFNPRVIASVTFIGR